MTGAVRGQACRCWFGVGALLHSMGSLQHAGRKSLPPPDVSFHLGELNLEYKLGDPVNRLVTVPEDPAEASQ
jgi:hypothetical protein